MNKLTTVALSVSMALALGACSPQQEAQSEQSSQQKPAAEKQQAQQLTSGIVLENFDKSARPQDDLNQYVNGAWMEKTEIPDDRSSVGSFFDLRERNQERLHKIIEKSANMEAAAGTNERKVGDFFNAYMDVETLNELGAKPIQSDLESINALDSYESVAEYFAHMSRMSTSIPFGFYVYPDAKDPQTNAMYVSQSGLGLPDREYYLSDEDKFKEFRTAYVEYISDVMEMAGVDNAKAAAERVLELETKLAEAQWTRVESRNADKTYNKMTASEVDELLGSFDFARYLKAADLNDVDNMIVSQPSYFEKLGEMFTDVDLQTWKDYLSFKVINDAASILSEDFSDRRFAFYGTTLRGIPEQEPRWKRGVDATNSV
ncbi:MAG: peptidase M13, partial [Idiomarinaceae bacterium]|nr:peptidase M13 [Idiomarinaceae bacterium]